MTLEISVQHHIAPVISDGLIYSREKEFVLTYVSGRIADTDGKLKFGYQSFRIFQIFARGAEHRDLISQMHCGGKHEKQVAQSIVEVKIDHNIQAIIC